MSWLCLGAMSSEAVALPETLSWSEVEIPDRPPTNPDLLLRGGRLFARYCAVCHGEAGEGNGVCAELLQPQPRDMTVGVYRFKSTTGSELATDQDLYRSVTVGLNGTSMPPFSSLLSGEERWAVVSFVTTLSPRFARAEPGVSIDLGQAPESPSQEQLDRGQKLFSLLRCTECHGEGGLGDGPSSGTLVDSSGQSISPRDLTRSGDFKRGHNARDIALAIATGLPGTPMPAYDAALEFDDLWALAAFVQSLADARRMAGTENLAGRADTAPEAGRFRVDETSPCYREAGRNRVLEGLMVVEPSGESD